MLEEAWKHSQTLIMRIKVNSDDGAYDDSDPNDEPQSHRVVIEELVGYRYSSYKMKGMQAKET